MVTLAFGQMIFFVFHDTKLGGGTDGAFLSRPQLAAFGWSLPLTRRQIPSAVFYVNLVLLVAMYLILVGLMRSLFGRVLEGIRVNEHRMRALGFDTTRYKLAAFVIAGALAGVAGHMWAMHRGFVNPELVSWHRSAEALLMILLGGLGSLQGAVVGGLALGVAEVFVRGYVGDWFGSQAAGLTDGLVFALIALLFVVRPQGLFNVATAERV